MQQLSGFDIAFNARAIVFGVAYDSYALGALYLMNEMVATSQRTLTNFLKLNFSVSIKM